MINSRSLKDLRPDVRANAELLLAECEKQGLRVLVTQTLRDDEYQAKLYAQGRTLPGQIVTNSKVTTFHGAGLAFDICQAIKGHEYSDLAFFANVAILAKHMGFTWGGDWKSFPDRPHFQWDAGGKWSGSLLRAKILPPMMPLYKPGTPKNQEEDTMTGKQIYDALIEYLNGLPTSEYAREASKRGVKSGLFKDGDKDGLIDNPRAPITRQDLAVVLDRKGLLE